MNKAKRYLAIFMTLALAMSMLIASSAASFAAADGTHEYTVEDPSDYDAVTGHTYKAYQIFTASGINEDGQYTNINFSANVAAATQTVLLGDAENAKVLAKSLGENDSATAIAFAKLAYANKSGLGTGTAFTSGTTVLSIGLWLIVDETTGEVDAINWANLYASDGKTAANVVSKVDAPSSEKKLKETNDTTGNVTDWQDAADYDIGDAIPFKISATLPSNYTDFATYHLTFHDKQSAGLTFNADSVKVYVGEATTPVAASNYIVKTSDVGTDTFQIIFDFAGLTAMNVTNSSVIRVEYTATLNNSAVYGQAGNPNTSWITYDNNPNSDQAGEEGGKTPEDTVIVFTFKTVANKVDEDNQPLSGAGFTLFKQVDENYSGTKEQGVNLTFADGVEHSEIKGANYYHVVKTINTGSTFTFEGLDSGTYVLVETTVPAGYNAWHSATVIVKATYTADNIDIDAATGKIVGEGGGGYVLTALADDGGTFTTVDNIKSTLSTTIENKSGAVLPATGGIGTVIFYVLGSLLVIGCGIVLITKKRMENK